MCKSVDLGRPCPYGKQCIYAHYDFELRKIPCRTIEMGLTCKFGDQCRYDHSMEKRIVDKQETGNKREKNMEDIRVDEEIRVNEETLIL